MKRELVEDLIEVGGDPIDLIFKPEVSWSYNTTYDNIPYKYNWMSKHDSYVDYKLEKYPNRFECQNCRGLLSLEDTPLGLYPRIKKRKIGGLKRIIGVCICEECIHIIRKDNLDELKEYIEEVSNISMKDLTFIDLIN